MLFLFFCPEAFTTQDARARHVCVSPRPSRSEAITSGGATLCPGYAAPLGLVHALFLIRQQPFQHRLPRQSYSTSAVNQEACPGCAAHVPLRCSLRCSARLADAIAHPLESFGRAAGSCSALRSHGAPACVHHVRGAASFCVCICVFLGVGVGVGILCICVCLCVRACVDVCVHAWMCE